jgi:polyferredoxin
MLPAEQLVRRGIVLRRLRRVSQALFFTLFLVVIVVAGSGGWYGNLFLRIDPLAAVATAFSTRTLPVVLLPALAVLAITMLMGRLFCGWVCPLGALNHWVGSAADRWGKNRMTRRVRNRWSSFHQVKFLLLIPLLLLAVAGTALVGLLDPVSLLTRGVSMSLLPSLAKVLEDGQALLASSPVSVLARMLEAMPTRLLGVADAGFRSGALLGFVLLLIIGLSIYRTRLWCRAVCPLGALLGVASRVSLWGVEKDDSRCTNCGRCIEVCQGGSEPQGGAPWKSHECVMCFNCQASCPEGAVRFRFYPPSRGIEHGADLSRRRILAGLALGAVAFPMLRSTRGPHRSPSPLLVRPPGAIDEPEFLKRCIRCGQCMRVCPNDALQPCLAEGGLEGLWTPVLVPRIGYCEPSCVECSHVCPTGALVPLSPEEKLKVRIGTAFYDRGRCLPWAMDRPCVVCEEHCPVSPKAIYLKEERVMLRDGSELVLGRPMVDPGLCIGCGVCEYVCVVRDRSAVYVTSAGETRSPGNRLLLESSGRA